MHLTGHVLGTAAVGVTWAAILLGMPSQIRLNRKLGSANGLCIRNLVLFQCSYLVWIVYGIAVRNWYVAACPLVSFPLGLVLIHQWWKGRPTQRRSSP